MNNDMLTVAAVVLNNEMLTVTAVVTGCCIQ
jgi:hypothetical protein